MSNENDPGLFGVHTLSNGRKYRLSDHGVYKPGEYPSGGVHIVAFEPRLDRWVYVDNSPDAECAREFLKKAAALPPLLEPLKFVRRGGREP